ncbi:MAG: hypothetical protein ACXVFK_16110 [Solirubrobacteraceae bacterium]
MAGDPFDVEHVDERTAVIRLHRGAGTAAGAKVDALLADLKGHDVRRLVVDLRSTSMLNSKVLDALVRGAADLDPRTGAGLAVVVEQPYVRQILEITETGGLLFLADTPAEALAALPLAPA